MEQKKITDLTEKEIQVKMLKLAKANHQYMKSIKNNVQFFVWCLFISLLFSFLSAVVMFGK